MKKIFIVLDGVADNSCKFLDGQTPLEAANKPNLDWFAENGQNGFMYPIKEQVVPDSDAAITSILGYNPNMESRGVIEAIGSDIKFDRGDLVVRTNFASIDGLEDRKILDRRAGRNLTSEEILKLESEINSIQFDFPFEFHATSQYRGILIFKGGFSDNISNTDPEYGSNAKRGEYVLDAKALDSDEDSELAADILNRFSEKVFHTLSSCDVNFERKKKGLMPANFLLFRDAGIEKPKFKKIKGKWVGFGYTPLVNGIIKSAGMKLESFDLPRIKTMDVYSYQVDLLKLACKKAIKALKRNWKKYDKMFIHFMETDVPAHDNKPLEKVKMIELVDRYFFSYLKKKCKDVEIVITSDHTTSCKFKRHTADPVPVIYFNGKRDDIEGFSESQALYGGLGKIYGKELLKKVGYI